MAWTCDIDGNDVTQYCQQITWHPRWSRAASVVIRVPKNTVSYTIGQSELHLYNGGLLFSGPVWFTEATGDENAQYLEITAYDHLIYLTKRMCKTDINWLEPPEPNTDPLLFPGPCNLADPTQMIEFYVTAPGIAAGFVYATISCDPPAARGGPGGPFPVQVGSVAAGGESMVGMVPVEWPMDIGTYVDLLLGTGRLGMIVNPGFGSSTVDFTNGGVVTDRTGSVNVQYATGSFNAKSGNRTDDMDQVVNALWYLLGPKVQWYTHDISHWMGSITPTARNAGGDGPGGNPAVPWDPALVSRWLGSQANYGYIQEIQIHDARDDEQVVARNFYEFAFENEAKIRAVPKTFVNNTPNRASGLAPSFFVGDTITMSAGPLLEGGWTGGFRVYEYEMAVDVDGVGEYTSIIGSDAGS